MVKFYPPDPENLRDNLTRYYMALQIRQNLMATFCMPALLGSYVVQSEEIGDYDPSDPRLTMSPICRTPRSWQCYGVDMHEARRQSRRMSIYVGVYHGGVLVYRNSLRINRFSWPKIMRLSLRIALRPADSDWRGERVVEFRCASSKLAEAAVAAPWLKSPEKPAKPLIPEHFKRNWNYTGPTRGQMNDQTLGPLPEALITPGSQELSKRRIQHLRARSWAAPVSTAPAARRPRPPATTRRRAHLRTNQHQQHQHSTLPAREQFDRRIELESVRPRRWCLTPLDADALTAPAPRWRSPTKQSMATRTRRPPLLTAACPGGDWLGVRADSGVRNGGQWYFEVVVDVPDGANRDADVDARIGWATASAGLRLGAADGHGFGFGAGPDGRQRHQVEDYGCRLRPGDVVRSLSLDLDSGLALFSLDLRAETFFPAGCARNGANLRWNFGDDPAQPLRHLPGGPWRPAGLAPVNQRTDNPRAWRLNHHERNWPGPGAWP
uniref:FERM_C domain-containing protein n=1 Tax=Macrostomum lignano TaxID=282301 RepID=A0A1I8JP83_9PLAT